MDFSNLVAACESAWRTIQKYNTDVPNVVIVVGSGGRMSPTLLGHFAKNTWEEDGEQLHEVLIVAEHLSREPYEIFTTLLHEATHGVAHVRGIKDVSGRRHNKKFANLCVEIGLTPPEKPDGRLGYSGATLDDTSLELYSLDIDKIGEQLKLCRKLNLVQKETKKTTWIAQCECERKLRLPKKTIEDPDNLNIVCQVCGAAFTLTEEDYDIFVEMFQ